MADEKEKELRRWIFRDMMKLYLEIGSWDGFDNPLLRIEKELGQKISKDKLISIVASMKLSEV